MVEDFKAYVRSQMRTPSQFDEAGFNADLEFIRAMIRYEIDIALFDVATARTPPDREGSAGAVRADAVRRGGEAAARDAGANTRRPKVG